MIRLVEILTIVTAGCLALAGLLHLLPRLGSPGRRLSAALCRAPLLDLVVAAFQLVPWIAGPLYAGWLGLLAAILGQAAALSLWIVIHEGFHRGAVRGPRIVKVINSVVGRWRNHAALWWITVALPIFWVIRLGEIFAYPPLVWLLGFPRYRQGEWVNVSRQKFTGLVGHDLVWCLYCDWMTGIYALGGDILRTIESFWCPIRFANAGKCDKCAVDFPDINHGWVRADGSLQEVADLLTEKYAKGRREWYGSPARLTVEGQMPRA